MSDVEILGSGTSDILGGPANTNVKETPGQAPKTSNIMNMIQARQKTLTISPEGKKFCNELKELAADGNAGWNFEYFRAGGIDTMLITDASNRYGMVLGFAESSSKVGNIPCVLNTASAVDSLKAKGITVLNTLIIGREDYPKVSIAYQNISDTLDAFLGTATASATLNDFRGYEIIMSTNPTEVAEFVDRNTMHSILPRHDVGSVFKLLKPGDKLDEALPFGAMTGYTTFLSKSTPVGYGAIQPEFTPMFHMEFHSGLADPAMLTLFLIPSYEYYCSQFGWISQFDTFKVGEPNIGYLVPGEDGKPWFCPDPQHRDTFIRQYIPHQAIGCLDCMTGRHQLPLALMLKGTPEANAAFRTRMARFLGVQDDPQVIPDPVIFTQPIFEYTGVIFREVPIDSRVVDYPFLVNTGVTNMLDLEPWTNYYGDPTIKPEKFTLWFGNNWEPRYQNNIKILNPNFLNLVSKYLDIAEIKVTFETRRFQQFGAGLISDPSLLGLGNQVHLQSSQRMVGPGKGGYQMFQL